MQRFRIWRRRLVLVVGAAAALWLARSWFDPILPHGFDGVGVLLAADAGCLAIDLDGDDRGAVAVEVWPAGMHGSSQTRNVRDDSGAIVAKVGDRVSVSGSVFRRHVDIDPCDAEVRATLSAFARVGTGSPPP